jgi:hypothetical protein
MQVAAPRSASARRLTAIVIACALAIGTSAACSKSTAPPKPSGKTPLADGASIGKIQRSAGGTAVVTEVRSLLTLNCAADQLTLRTNLEAINGKMDCSRMISQPILDRFLGLPVVVTYSGETLQIESPVAGTIVLPNVKDATLEEIRATP